MSDELDDLITSEMIDAGARAVETFKGSSPRDLVRNVFKETLMHAPRELAKADCSFTPEMAWAGRAALRGNRNQHPDEVMEAIWFSMLEQQPDVAEFLKRQRDEAALMEITPDDASVIRLDARRRRDHTKRL